MTVVPLPASTPSLPPPRDYLDTLTALSADVSAASTARERVAAALPFLPAALRHDAVLLTSELVSNAVLHGKPPITLRLATAPGSVLVEVHDHGTTTAPTGDLVDVTQHAGRGLFLVHALSTRWGVNETAGRVGKTVWFELKDLAPLDGNAALPEAR